MWKLRYYLPLVGFLLPTLVIGYGFVIPASCIRGVNELSVGFGSTVFGAALTYLAGIRAATRAACPARAPWRVRFGRYLNRQASHPRGPFGWLLGVFWSFEHRTLNRATLGVLGVRSTDHVLDLGCGSGTGVREAAKLAAAGHVTGLDVSKAVLDLARLRNLALVRAGRVRFSAVDAVELGLSSAAFDRIFSVHSLYFWKEPGATLRQLAAALRPGGRLVLAFRPAGAHLPARFRDPTYRFYTPDQVLALLSSAGFRGARVVVLPKRPANTILVVAERSD